MKGPMETRDEVPAADKVANSSSDNFADFMWMAEEGVEDFDKKCEEEFVNDGLMDLYLQQMLDDEEEEEQSRALQNAGNVDANGWWYPPPNCQPRPQVQQQRQPVPQVPQVPGQAGGDPAAMLAGRMQRMDLVQQQQQPPQQPAPSHLPQVPVVSSSKLNPNASVFVPRFLQATADDR